MGKLLSLISLPAPVLRFFKWFVGFVPYLLLAMVVYWMINTIHQNGQRLGEMHVTIEKQGDDIRNLSGLVVEMQTLNAAVEDIRDKQNQLTAALSQEYQFKSQEAEFATANNRNAIIDGTLSLSVPIREASKYKHLPTDTDNKARTGN